MTKKLLVTGALVMGVLSAEDSKIPRFRLDAVGWTLTGVAVGAIALDHDSTRRVIRAGGYETNGLISNGRGGVNYRKAIALDAASIGAILLSEGIAKWHVPKKYQWVNNWVIRPVIGVGLAYRLKAGPVHNYRLLHQHTR